jgi:hypothetical protein
VEVLSEEVNLKENKEKGELKLKEEWQIKKSSYIVTEDRYQKDRCRGSVNSFTT